MSRSAQSSSHTLDSQTHAFAPWPSQRLDKDGDGQIDAEELAELAREDILEARLAKRGQRRVMVLSCLLAFVFMALVGVIVGTTVAFKDTYVDQESGQSILADSGGSALATAEHLVSIPLVAAPALSSEALLRAKTVRVSYVSPTYSSARGQKRRRCQVLSRRAQPAAVGAAVASSGATLADGAALVAAVAAVTAPATGSAVSAAAAERPARVRQPTNIRRRLPQLLWLLQREPRRVGQRRPAGAMQLPRLLRRRRQLLPGVSPGRAAGSQGTLQRAANSDGLVCRCQPTPSAPRG